MADTWWAYEIALWRESEKIQEILDWPYWLICEVHSLIRAQRHRDRREQKKREREAARNERP